MRSTTRAPASVSATGTGIVGDLRRMSIRQPPMPSQCRMIASAIWPAPLPAYSGAMATIRGTPVGLRRRHPLIE
jgi:hypothetical protein